MTTQDRDRIRFFTRHFNDLQGLRYWVPLGLVILSGAACFANPALAFLLFIGAFFLMLGARQYYRATLGEVERESVTERCSLSVYSPAGPTPRLEGFQLAPPAVEGFLAILGLAFALFFVLQAISPANTIVEAAQVRAMVDAIYKIQPWTQGIVAVGGVSAPLPPLRILAAQMIYVLFGTLFFYLWFWRERRASQGYLLVLALPLLGLGAFGGSLGYFIHEERAAVVDVINALLSTVTNLWVTLLLCGLATIFSGLLDHRQLVRGLGRPATARE